MRKDDEIINSYLPNDSAEQVYRTPRGQPSTRDESENWKEFRDPNQTGGPVNPVTRWPVGKEARLNHKHYHRGRGGTPEDTEESFAEVVEGKKVYQRENGLSELQN